MVQMDQLHRMIKKGSVKREESLAKHTTFRIGGPAECYVEPADVEELTSVLQYCQKENTPYFIIGNGSNLLVSDQGYRGVVISTKGFDKLQFLGKDPLSGKEVVTVGSGIMLSTFASKAAQHACAGFEFASGIPGTLGGAVTMNAGAYGGEIKDVLQSAMVLTRDGEVRKLTRDELQLSYRHSLVQEQDMIVLEATFAFETGELEQVETTIRELNAKRREKQPLEYGSAGSTFKRPEGHFAGKLIQDAGLRGYRVGDVMVSEKHCGFVVNVGNGTCQQAMEVIHHVQEEVMNQFGVPLELEIKCLS